jgi:serine/threonine-protein phosphatase 5
MRFVRAFSTQNRFISQHSRKESVLKIDVNHFNIDTAKAMIGEFRDGKMINGSSIEHILERIRAIHEPLPNVVDLPARSIKVVGDVHGQFHDLLTIFQRFGFPSIDNRYLFNGDFVDRGSQGIETVLTLFALKLVDNHSIYLNRGNHETDDMNHFYGFSNECDAKLKKSLFQQFSSAFESLPLGHIIGNSVLVIHGGLFGDESVTIRDIQKARRFCQPGVSGVMTDILWSDPIDQNGIRRSPRGVGHLFGPDVTTQFLKSNGLKLLIRSHQCPQEGYVIQHAGKCITVFSAPNYMGLFGNTGCVVDIAFTKDGELENPTFTQFPAAQTRRNC